MSEVEMLMKILLEYSEDIEKATKKLRENLAAFVQKNMIVDDWDPTVIKWVEAEGPSGKYELASSDSNKDNVDFQKLLKDLEAHKGKLTKENMFYWKFEKTDSVGRKKQKGKT